jgi:hypothetical protein
MVFMLRDQRESLINFLVPAALAWQAGAGHPGPPPGMPPWAAATAHVADGKGYGLPTLIEFFGDAVAKRIAKILGYRERGEPTSDDGRPVLKVVGGQLSGNADKAEEILIAAGVPFFERSNKLVRPIVKDVDTFRGNKTSVAQLTAVSETYMRDMLGRVAGWCKYDLRSKSWVPVDPPHDVAGTILARAGEWKFPSVAGIITTQTMRPDGTILDQPGYDPTTRLLLVNPPQMKPIPDHVVFRFDHSDQKSGRLMPQTLAATPVLRRRSAIRHGEILSPASPAAARAPRAATQPLRRR